MLTRYGSAVLGVLVQADNNPQMMCYALGALEMFDFIYDIKTVKMTIFQPRRENISTFSMSKEELLTWADEVLAPTATLAYEGKGEFKAGEHCQFCKVKATCRKRAEYNLELAKYDFAMPDTLEETEIAISMLSIATEIRESPAGSITFRRFPMVNLLVASPEPRTISHPMMMMNSSINHKYKSHFNLLWGGGAKLPPYFITESKIYERIVNRFRNL